MPSGKTHDVITILIAAPAAAGAFLLFGDALTAGLATAAFLFGGLMFGPDLDTVSKQYSRWGPLRLVWFPYRSFLKHRSRWSHGLVFGTLFRVVYFIGILTIAAFLAMTLVASAWSAYEPSLGELMSGWAGIGEVAKANGYAIPMAIFAGMWVGAASHTLTDVAITYITTGRVKMLL